MGEGLEILVLDDEPIVGDRLKPFLEGDGHRVEVFVDPKEALARLKAGVRHRLDRRPHGEHRRHPGPGACSGQVGPDKGADDHGLCHGGTGPAGCRFLPVPMALEVIRLFNS